MKISFFSIEIGLDVFSIDILDIEVFGSNLGNYSLFYFYYDRSKFRRFDFEILFHRFFLDKLRQIEDDFFGR